MTKAQRSACPLSLALDVFGDKWTLLIMRDMMFEGKTRFREFLESREKIATNILTQRLRLLEDEKIIYKRRDKGHKQIIHYYLTEKGIDLFPILMEQARWSLKYKPVDEDDAIVWRNILHGGNDRMTSIMADLMREHKK